MAPGMLVRTHLPQNLKPTTRLLVELRMEKNINVVQLRSRNQFLRVRTYDLERTVTSQCVCQQRGVEPRIVGNQNADG